MVYNPLQPSFGEGIVKTNKQTNTHTHKKKIPNKHKQMLKTSIVTLNNAI